MAAAMLDAFPRALGVPTTMMGRRRGRRLASPNTTREEEEEEVVGDGSGEDDDDDGDGDEDDRLPPRVGEGEDMPMRALPPTVVDRMCGLPGVAEVHGESVWLGARDEEALAGEPLLTVRCSVLVPQSVLNACPEFPRTMVCVVDEPRREMADAALEGREGDGEGNGDGCGDEGPLPPPPLRGDDGLDFLFLERGAVGDGEDTSMLLSERLSSELMALVSVASIESSATPMVELSTMPPR